MDLQSRGQADADCLFLANVLDKLYDFGGGAEASQRFTSQRKRKRRRGDEPVREEPSDCRADVRADPRRHMKSEQAGPSSQNQVEVVVFQDPRKKRKAKESPAPRTVSKAEETQSEQIEELNLEKARLEVHRFGITGFKKEQQRVFEQDRAVMLGARVSRRARHHARINQLFYDFAVVSSSAASEGVRQLQNAAAAEEEGEGRRAASKSSAEPPHLRMDVMFGGMFCVN
uniref:Uncharacterized protein n=1 Tax=Takifugu rubripes TaxID=31033 RepID=A0A674MTG3_TAKRU